MSRAFAHATGDYIDFAPGSMATLNGGSQTLLFLWKADTSVQHGLIGAKNVGGSLVWGVNPFTDLKYYYSVAPSFVSADTYAIGTWYLFGISKAAGTSTVRTHVYDYTATTWTHTNWLTLADATNGPVTSVRLAWLLNSTDTLNGKIAAAAAYNTVLSDLTVQGLNSNFNAWMAATPVWAIKLNQTSVATAVTDQTGNGGNQSGISGTSVSADEPAGWSYAGPVIQVGRWGVHI